MENKVTWEMVRNFCTRKQWIIVKVYDNMTYFAKRDTAGNMRFIPVSNKASQEISPKAFSIILKQLGVTEEVFWEGVKKR